MIERNEAETIARGLSRRMMETYRNLLLAELMGFNASRMFYRQLLILQREDLDDLKKGIIP